MLFTLSRVATPFSALPVSAQLEHLYERNDHTTLADLGQHPLPALEPHGRGRVCQPVDDDSRRHRRAATEPA